VVYLFKYFKFLFNKKYCKKNGIIFLLRTYLLINKLYIILQYDIKLFDFSINIINIFDIILHFILINNNQNPQIRILNIFDTKNFLLHTFLKNS